MATSNRNHVINEKWKKFEEVKMEAWSMICTQLEDAVVYNEFLYNTLLAGLCQFDERHLWVRIREADYYRTKCCIPIVEREFKSKSGRTSELQIYFSRLPHDCTGGAEFFTRNEEISCSSTIESRFHLVIRNCLPYLQSLLFTS
ncbi:uncharacterized protein LOC121878892 [Homarus americanus]|nr:uncharacterized protein LOC121878892 [Homarus americanus]